MNIDFVYQLSIFAQLNKFVDYSYIVDSSDMSVHRPRVYIFSIKSANTYGLGNG